MLLQTRLYSSLVLVVMVRCTMVNPPGLGEEFRQCALTQPQTLGTCIGVGAISRLQYLDNNPEFELVDGVTLMRNNDQEYREEFSAPAADPSSFRYATTGYCGCGYWRLINQEHRGHVQLRVFSPQHAFQHGLPVSRTGDAAGAIWRPRRHARVHTGSASRGRQRPLVEGGGNWYVTGNLNLNG